MLSIQPPEWMTANPILTILGIKLGLAMIVIIINLALRYLIYAIKRFIFWTLSSTLLRIASFAGWIVYLVQVRIYEYRKEDREFEKVGGLVTD